ncbi:MAG: hypothetical protein IH586_10180 [Anaerolineaceae bacterium]|nr:hypothetical protein [Anaerolineaceae bacterium]
MVQVSCSNAPQKNQETAAPQPTPTLGGQFINKAWPTNTPATRVESDAAIDSLVRVEVTKNVHPISPLIYGVSGASKEVLNILRPTLNSWGGNPSTRYNWLIGHAWNAGSDWFYRNGNYGFLEGSASDQFAQEAQDAGIVTRFALPILGWVAKDDNNATCSFPQADGSCGDANGATCANPGEIADPTTANVASNPASISEWVTHLSREKGYNIRFLALDNEPELWGYTHYDVHPNCTTYSEILAKYIEYTQAVHQVIPETEFAGPVTCCWQYYWDSAAGPVDKLQHGNQDFLPWFLESIRKQDLASGWRSLHVLDLHYYPDGLYNNNVDEATAAWRLRSTRSLWDESYIDESWIGKPVYLIPRMKQLLNDFYPETRFGISEWNWGADNTMNGALAIADVLGIFGVQDLYYASYWQYPEIGSPGFNAFKLYTNYDGKGSRFGDISVWSDTSNQTEISSYAALDSLTGNLHVMLINKNPEKPYNINIKLGGYTAGTTIDMYRLDTARSKEIVKSSLGKIGENLNLDLPAYSISLLVYKGKTN